MSSTDLLEDYFKRDLGRAEDEALAQDLAASPELSGRFARLAAEDYSRLGLPEPVWPEKGSRKRLVWLLLLAAGTLTGLGVWQAQSRVEKPAVLIAREEGGLAVEAPLNPSAAEAPASPPRPQPAAAQHLRVQASTQGFLVALDPGPGQGPLSVQDAQGHALCQVPVDANGRWLWRGIDAQGRAVSPGSYRLVAEAQGRSLVGWVEVGRRHKP